MDRNNNNRDPENTNSVENHADVRGNGNKTNQAGGHIVEGDYNPSPDEGRVKADAMNALVEISSSIGRFFLRTGVGDRLERLSFPSAGIVAVFLLTVLGNDVHAAFELTGIAGTLTGIAAYAYSQFSGPLLAALGERLAIAAVLALLLGLPIWYRVARLTTTCETCNQPFATLRRTIAYPSRASFDQEGNRHVPMEDEWFCIYCDGDVEIAGNTQSGDEGESAPPVMTDGGGDNDAGVCSCSCHNED